MGNHLNLKDWDSYKILIKQEVLDGLEFDYNDRFPGHMKKKKAIVEALSFWRYVMEQTGSAEKNNKSFGEDAEIDWAKRYWTLSAFFNYQNRFIRLVAMLESLPTVVWRKFLWKANLDFMSFESFLRRFDIKNEATLAQICEDIYTCSTVPKSLKLGKITIGELLYSPLDADLRYQSKAEMSYNLLNLDFGFNAYPKGVRNDEKVVEISPLRFLSKKQHADDFVVNTEDGRYWWMYRTARSDYAFRPNRKVALKTHICPGFWLTMLVHFLFWIVSPACGILTYFSYFGFSDSIPLFVKLPIWLMSLFTQTWLLIAMFRYVFSRPIFGKAGEAIVAGVSRIGDLVGPFFAGNKQGLIKIAIAIIVSILTVMLGSLFYWLFQFIKHGTGEVLAVSSIAAIYAYLGYKIWYRMKHYIWCSIFDFPRYLLLPIAAVAGVLVARFVHLYHNGIMSTLRFVYESMTDLLLAMGAATIFFTIPIAIGATLVYLSSMDERRLEWACESIGGILGKIVLGMFVFLTTACVIAILKGSEINLAVMFTFYALNAILWLELEVLRNTDPRINSAKKAKKRLVSNLYGGSSLSLHEGLFLKNQWLKNLDENEKVRFINRIIIIMEIFPSAYYQDVAQVLIPAVNDRILSDIEACAGDIRELCDYVMKVDVIAGMVAGLRFEHAHEKALAMAVQRMNEKSAREEMICKIKKFFGVVFFPFVFLGRMFMKIVEYAMTIKRLLELFSKLCPYVQRSQTLKFK